MGERGLRDLGGLRTALMFIGLVLLGPLAVKLGSTGYRFARYYLQTGSYRRKGPPPAMLRAVAPVVVGSTVVVFASGVILLFDGPVHRSLWLLVHKASFFVWIAFTALHVLGHLPGLGSTLRAGTRRSSETGTPGSAARWIALGGALAAAVPALAYIPAVPVLLRRAAARANEGSRTRDVTLTGTLQIGDAAPVQRVLALRFPLTCRFDGGAQARGTEAQPLPSSAAGNPEQELLELACPLIAYRGLKTVDAEGALQAAATIAGADLTGPAAYDRLGDRVVIVVGAPPRQLERPQLWLYKDTHAPARLIAFGAE